MRANHIPPTATKSLSDRFDVILELLEALQALPSDIGEVKAAVDRLEQDNDICYTVLKEQGWLLKDHHHRLKKLEA